MASNNKNTVLAAIYRRILQKANEHWLKMSPWETALYADLFAVGG